MNSISSNDYLTLSEMKENAEYIYAWCTTRGWSVNAIAGMLGNMQTESTINPGLWENRDQGNMDLGFGLVQWTPATKYTEWVTGEGGQWASIDWQLKRIEYEVENGLQWISTTAYPLSFSQFKISTETPEYLAQAFLKNYERPSNQNQPIRSTQARYWFDIINQPRYEVAYFLLDMIYITQGENGSYSHKGTLSIDFVGTYDKYPYYAPCKVKCVAILPSSASVIWSTVDPVVCADGFIRHITFSCIHEQPLWQSVGMIKNRGELIGHTGIGGNVTGDHLHLQVIRGNQYRGFTQNSEGSWTLVGEELHIYDVFHVNDVNIVQGYDYPWTTWEGGIIPPKPNPPSSETNALIHMLLAKTINGW